MIGTASGSISTFIDGVDLPLNKLIVGIDSQSGVSECNLTRCGNNLFNLDSKISTTYANVIYTSDANFVTLNGVKNGGGYANFSSAKITLPANTYYAKAFVISGTCSNQSNIEMYLYDGNSNVTSNIINTEREITLSEETTVNLRIAIWRDNTAFDEYKLGVIISTNHITEYNTYNGNTYNIQFPSGVTISNGSIDILNGVLTDDDLSEEYNITPIAIRSLDGVNNVFADTGDIEELEYIQNSSRLSNIPDLPTTAGNYVLKVTVTSGVPSFEWVAES